MAQKANQDSHDDLYKNIPIVDSGQPLPCRLIEDGRIMQREMLSFHPEANPILFDHLIESGYVRGFVSSAFRISCTDCKACVPVRTNVEAFNIAASKSFPKLLDTNRKALHRHSPDHISVAEHINLMEAYVDARHPANKEDGSDAEAWKNNHTTALIHYAKSLKNPSHRLHLDEYRIADPKLGPKGKLVGTCWYYSMENGLSTDQFYFDPAYSKLGLGNYMILETIETARRLSKDHVYLGPWTREKSRYSYKSRFANEQRCATGKWEPIDVQP